MRSNLIRANFFAFAVFSIFDAAYCGSCFEAKLCCPGRDSSCVVQKTPINAIVEDANEKPCYCDHACLKLGDCCSDFNKACNVIDCTVSVWQPWSECDTDCGAGMMTRRRSVLKQPANGGKHCPSLIQKRGCLGTNCPQNPRSALKEIAMLLPIKTEAKFSNETEDRLNDIDSKYPDDSEHDSKQYCVLFEILKATKACRKELSFSTLREGEKVCVRCDNEAMRPSLGFRCTGHGTMDRTTRWTTLTAPHCHGKWVRLDSSHQVRSTNISPVCPVCLQEPKFVFV
ncbi:hypothetical protein PGB90_004259 [Kerria lacca]